LTQRDRFHASLSGDTEAGYAFVPITMMYAADRIGVPYVDYETKAPSQIAGQLALAEAFDASVVSAISDPAVEAADLGAYVSFPEGSPAHLVEEKSLLAEPACLSELTAAGIIEPANGSRMANRLAVVRGLRDAAGEDRIIEGWVEGPCAEAADLRGINRLMMDFYGDQEFLTELFDFITEQEIAFARAQVEAGADIIGIGDAASSLVGPVIYEEWIAPRTKRYVETIHEAGALVRLHICGRTQQLAPSIALLGVDMIDIDAGNDIASMRAAFSEAAPDGVGPAIAGNLDPVTELKDGSTELIRTRLSECRDAAGPKFMVGAGCEVPRGTPEENLNAMRMFAANGG
jgi:MtaA/CmuA family methyltransferase